MQKFLPDFLISISLSFPLLPCSCRNNPPTKYPRVIYIPNMSHSKSDLGPHSPMAASIQSGDTPRKPSDLETASLKVGEKGVEVTEKNSMEKRDDSVDGGSIGPTYDHTHRKLKPRHVQLIGIGGTIGTALYVQIGSGLRTSGPGSLFLGFSIWYVYTPPCLSFSSLVCSFGETSGVSTKSCWVDVLDKVSIYKSRLHISKAKQKEQTKTEKQEKREVQSFSKYQGRRHNSTSTPLSTIYPHAIPTRQISIPGLDQNRHPDFHPVQPRIFCQSNPIKMESYTFTF